MQLEAIKIFCDVAIHRSISRSAELNGISQSAVSQRLMALEDQLGTQLLDRSTRPLKLTDAGETYFLGCQQIIRDYRKLEQEVAATREGYSGTIRMAAIYSAGCDLLNEAKADFELQNPDARIEVKYLHPSEVCKGVKKSEFDLGIISYPNLCDGLSVYSLREEEMGVICKIDHPLAERPKIHANDLHDRPMVNPTEDLPIAAAVNDYLKSHQVQAHQVDTFDNLDTIKRFVGESSSVAILPLRAALREIKSGSLAGIQLEPKFTRPVGVICRKQESLPASIRSFIDLLILHQASASENATATVE